MVVIDVGLLVVVIALEEMWMTDRLLENEHHASQASTRTTAKTSGANALDPECLPGQTQDSDRAV